MKEQYLDRNQPLVSETDYACHYWSDSMELLFPYFDFTPGKRFIHSLKFRGKSLCWWHLWPNSHDSQNGHQHLKHMLSPTSITNTDECSVDIPYTLGPKLYPTYNVLASKI